ncbi:MAG: BatD family protein [Bacteroidales bacterium]|nr:BatD family protein [Bacteroidales bacterium]MCF8327386.1 BatD family protein [Bacteroidales bacterium]
MKLHLTAVFIFISFSLLGQGTAKLWTSNPQPRVNERITVSMYSHSNLINDLLQKELNKSEITIYDSTGTNYRNYVSFQQPGNYEIGPFSYNLNSKKYTTDALNVEVIPALPSGKGIILRKAEINNTIFLYIEYYEETKESDKKPDAKKSKGWDSLVKLSDEYEDTFFSAVTKRLGTLKNQEGKESHTKRIVYKLKKQHPEQDKITIDRGALENVPEGIEVKPLTIQL